MTMTDMSAVEGARQAGYDAGYADALSLRGKPLRPLFPLPVRPMPARTPGFTVAGIDTGVGRIALWGHCADFCSIDGPTNGQTIEEHGPLCVSDPVGFGRLEGQDLDAEPVNFYTDLVEGYLHGIYKAESGNLAHHRRFVRLRVAADGVKADSDDISESRSFHLEPHVARSLAAELVRGADLADGLTRDLRQAKLERDAEAAQ
jgi:hypothetical protein